MSLFGKKKNARLVGAREKREKAMGFNTKHEIKSKKEGPQSGPSATLILIWLLSVGAAFFMKDLNLHSGIGFLDEIFSGSSSLLAVSSSPDINLLVTTLLRGTVIFFLSGTIPLIAHLWEKIIDRSQGHPYYIVWGVIASLGLVFFLVKDFVLPAIDAVFTIITG
jgi:hypothetical protein